MSAPDLATLYDFETQIEAAVSAILTDGGVTVQAVSRGEAILASPFCAVTYQHGGPWPSGSPRYVSVGGDFRPDQFSGTVQITAATDRKRNPDTHKTYRGKIRALGYQFVGQFTGSNLPYLAVMDFTETGTQPVEDEGKNLDLSILSWDIRFAILPNAWPT